MKNENNRECLLCKREYRYCNSCSEFKTLPRWMSLFDRDICHEIFNIVSGFNTNVITPEEAREKLLEQDLSEIGLYQKNVQDAIDKILGIVETEKPKDLAADEDITFVRPAKMRKRRKSGNVEQ